MAVVFGGISILCLIYYGIIVVYSGIRTSFSAVWLVLALVTALMASSCHFYSRYKERIPLWLTVSSVTVATTFFVVFLSVEVAIGLNFISLQKQSVDYVIVLGTQVRGKTMSKSLEHRLEKALEYTELHPNTVLILSGGQGRGEDVSEAEIMYEYLKQNGVPEFLMIKEEHSTSTYENLMYSKLILEGREAMRRATIREAMKQAGYMAPPDEEMRVHVGIITSNFHMLRAKGIAAKAGISDPYGICAPSDPVLFLHFCVRECFAILKDKFMGNM